MNNWFFVIILCLTLGLAPFQPEPHIIEKIKIIFSSPSEMQLIDWLDTLMHGLPWILLLRLAIITIKSKTN